MFKLTSEMWSVGSTGDGLLVIRFDQLWDYSIKLGGDFVCEMDAAGWLADRLDAAAGPCGAPPVDQLMPPDHFLIFVRGGERGEDLNVNLHNRRDPSAPRGGNYALSAITPEGAKSIAAEMRAINSQ